MESIFLKIICNFVYIKHGKCSLFPDCECRKFKELGICFISRVVPVWVWAWELMSVSNSKVSYNLQSRDKHRHHAFLYTQLFEVRKRQRKQIMNKSIYKIAFTLLVAGISLSSVSCEKESDDEFNSTTTNSEYYVQYSASAGGMYLFLENINVTTDKGKLSYDVRTGSWSQIYGPVKYGFKASISTSGSDRAKTEIYISKDNGPFALKAEGGKGCSCTINF